jgi:tight adherence protein C
VLAPLLDRTLSLGKKLEVAGNPPGWTVDRVTSLKFIGFAAALVISLVLAVLFGLGFAPTLALAVIAALVGYMAPNMYLYQKGYDRTKAIQKSIPDALDLLTISVESGLGFDAALSHVARNTDGPLADEFARVLQEMQIGLGRGAALRALGDRTHVPELKGFVSAMVQADALGIPIAQVLRVQAREIRTKRRQRAEEQAQKVAVKILIPLIFCILPCLFIAVLGPAAIGIMEAFSGRL